jgi:hypothetical protein
MARPITKLDTPLGGICPACKQPQTYWKRTPFGDVICNRCYELDATANPDIYGDPNATRTLWHDVKETLRLSRIVRGFSPSPCAICKRTPSDRNRDIPWVRFTTGKWVCQVCYPISQRVTPGEYCLDSRGRCFIVTNELAAQYPNGIRKLPALLQHEGASATLYSYQSEVIHKLTTEYHDFAMHIAYKYQARRQHVLSLDEAHDVATLTLMNAASLYREMPQAPPDISRHSKRINAGWEVPRTFGNYLTKALHQSLKRQCVRNYRRNAKQSILIDSDIAYEVAAECEASPDARESRLQDWLAFKAACMEKIGFADWNLFTEWILLDRRQLDLGRERGITSQAVSMRLQKIIRECRALAQTNDRWKQLTATYLLE